MNIRSPSSLREQTGEKSLSAAGFDEAFTLSVEATVPFAGLAQLALLSKLDATGQTSTTIWVFTCNTTDGLEPQFLSRCRVIEFSGYGMAGAIAAYLDKVWHAEGGNGNAPNLTRIAKESRNNVRDCLNAT